MSQGLQQSPFVAISTRDSPRADVSEELDCLGSFADGKLYWNSSTSSLGLVCGFNVHETSKIVRRLMASHLRDPKAKVLVLHTDHFAIRKTSCPLIHPAWSQSQILTSPLIPSAPTSASSLTHSSTLPITFSNSSMLLQHVLSLFTPSMLTHRNHTVPNGIQLILSQLHEPFDLQRFTELVDQEKWNDEGASFIALRQTLLTRLLSQKGRPAQSERIRIVDMTDPLLYSTGLDGSILNMALHDFINDIGANKMIVLNNCEQYLKSSSYLTATIEALATCGDVRPASIILSTKDPTTISLPILNSLDYLTLTTFRSQTWNRFLYDHFQILVPKEQKGRAIIWSPQLIRNGSSIPEFEIEDSWERDLIFIDIDQFEASMPLYETLFKEEIPKSGVVDAINENYSSQDTNITQPDSFEEPGVVSFNGLHLGDSSQPSGPLVQPARLSDGKADYLRAPNDHTTTNPESNKSDVSYTNSIGKMWSSTPTAPTDNPPSVLSPALSPTANQDSVQLSKLMPTDFPFSHRVIVLMMIKLTDGSSGLKVRLTDLKSSLKAEYPGAREEFLQGLISKAREELTVIWRLDEDWIWLVDRRPQPHLQGPHTQNTRAGEIHYPDRLASLCPLDEYPIVYHPLITVLWAMTDGQYNLRIPMESVIGVILTDFPTKYQDAANATALIFEAYEENIVICGKANEVWWVSLGSRTNDAMVDAHSAVISYAPGDVSLHQSPRSLEPSVDTVNSLESLTQNEQPMATFSTTTLGGQSPFTPDAEAYVSLLSAISELKANSKHGKVTLSALRTEMKIDTVRSIMYKYGWSTLDQWVQAACLDGYLDQEISDDSVILTVVEQVDKNLHQVDTLQLRQEEEPQIRQAAKFGPLISAMLTLGTDQMDDEVSYQAVKQEMKKQKAELMALKWKSFEELRETACEQRIIDIIRVDGKIGFLRLLPFGRSVDSFAQYQAENSASRMAQLSPQPQPIPSEAIEVEEARSVALQGSPVGSNCPEPIPTPQDTKGKPSNTGYETLSPRVPVPYNASQTIENNAVQLTRFQPLIQLLLMLGDGKPNIKVTYKDVKREMKKRRDEIKNLGWRSFEKMRDVSFEKKIVEVIFVDGKMGFLKLSTSITSTQLPMDQNSARDYESSTRTIGSPRLSSSAKPPASEAVDLDQSQSAVTADCPLPGEAHEAALASRHARQIPQLTAEESTAISTPASVHYQTRSQPLISVMDKLNGGKLDAQVGHAAVKMEMNKRQDEMRRFDWESYHRRHYHQALERQGRDEGLNGGPLLVATDAEYPKLSHNILFSSIKQAEGVSNQDQSNLAMETTKSPFILAPPLGAVAEKALHTLRENTRPTGLETSTLARMSALGTESAIVLGTVVATIIKLSKGKDETKVRMADLFWSLQTQYPKFNHNVLFSSVKQAEEEGAVLCGRDASGLEWVTLIDRNYQRESDALRGVQKGVSNQDPSTLTAKTTKPPSFTQAPPLDVVVEHAQLAVKPDCRLDTEPRNQSVTHCSIDNGLKSTLEDDAMPAPSIPTSLGPPPATDSSGVEMRRFYPLTSLIRSLTNGNANTQIEYNIIKREMKKRYAEIRIFGWISFESLRETAYKQGIIDLVRSSGSGKISFLKLLPTADATDLLSGTFSPLDQINLAQRILRLSGCSPGQKEIMIDLIPGLSRQYPDMDDESLLSLVISLTLDENKREQQRDATPAEVTSSSIASSDNRKLVNMQDAIVITIVELSNRSGIAPLTDVLSSLQTRYPELDSNAIFSSIVQADEERIVRCERDDQGHGWVTLTSPSRQRGSNALAEAQDVSNSALRTVYDELLHQRSAPAKMKVKIGSMLKEDGGGQFGYLKES